MNRDLEELMEAQKKAKAPREKVIFDQSLNTLPVGNLSGKV